MRSTTLPRWLAGPALLVLTLLPRSAWAALPADGWLIWESTRLDARPEIYRAHADGTEIVRLTMTGGLLPLWAPDGRWIAYRDESNAGFLMRPDGSDSRPLSAGTPSFWLHDNSGIAVLQGGQVYRVDPETQETILLADVADFPQFGSASFGPNSISQDNRYLLLGSDLFINGYTATNGSFRSDFSAVVLDLFHKDRTYYFGSGCWPVAAPEGDLIFHVCADCPTHPDLYHMHLADLDTRKSYAPEEAHVDSDWGHEYNPRVSTDNKWLSYMASTGCHDGANCDYDIFVHEIGAGPTERTHVISDPAGDLYPHIYVGPLWQKESQPRLLLTPYKLIFYAGASIPAAAQAAQTIKIKNSGGGSLGAAVVTTDPAASWLDVQTNGTSAITFALRNDVVRRGTYQTTVTVMVDGALGSPASVPVTLVADETYPDPDGGVPILSGLDSAVASNAGDDGGVAADDAPSANPDANAPATKGGSGCGCTLGGPSRGTDLVFLVGLALVCLARRRSRQ
jgi:hypothetical protein